MTLAPIRDDLILYPPDTDSWTTVVAEVAKLAGHIAGTEFVPKGLRDNPAAVTAAILFGREVGLPPMTALGQVYVADGRPAMHAEGMRALVLAAGHDLEVVEHTGAVCSIRGRRTGQETWSKPVTWNLDMARAAGLLPAKAGSGWLKYPRAMLLARASAELCRRDFADVIHGLLAIEELDDETAPEESGPTTTRVARRRPSRPVPITGPSEFKVPEPPPPGHQPAVEAPPARVPPPPPPSGANTSPSAPDGADVDSEPGGEPGSESADPTMRTLEQRTKIILAMRGLGITDRDDRLDVLTALVGRKIETSDNLTRREASAVLDTLALCQTEQDLSNAVSAALAHYASTDHPDIPDQPPLPVPEAEDA